jgi:hypothetical protein
MRALFATYSQAGFLLDLFFDPDDGVEYLLSFNGLHGVVWDSLTCSC